MKKLTKTQRVEKYLNQLMKGRYFKIDDLLALSASKLQENTPLLDISESTITGVLSTYKEKYNPKKRKPAATRKKVHNHPVKSKPAALLPEEVTIVRKIIDWFEYRMQNDLSDFEDLQAALAEIGLDYRKILDQYRSRK